LLVERTVDVEGARRAVEAFGAEVAASSQT
jgi:hypothetical protein